jgi:predicted ATPase
MTAWVLAGARSQPVVLAFEDLQWADPTSLDLLRALADRGGQAPLFLIATSRSEFRPSWGMRSHHSAISLAPLKRAQVHQMVGQLASRHALSKDVVEGVTERTGGVPLFVEEVTRLLLERGEQGGVQAIPPTLQQSLAARLDRLGSAREAAQIGAVLGREFAYPLLREVAELDESALQASLDRLADADLLFVEGAPPQASYRFKHALIQDAAYESLLKSRRQALHRRAAERLRDDPERAAAAPELIAHHFTQAGHDDLAIEWWGKAGDRALRRSAFQEAIAHLGKAIAMADKTGAGSLQANGAAVSNQRLKLQIDYGRAVGWSKGFAGEEAKAAYTRAAELAKMTEDFSARFAAYSGQSSIAFFQGDLLAARKLAETILRQAEEEGHDVEAIIAHGSLAHIAYFAGNLSEARTEFEWVLAAGNPRRDEEVRQRLGDDIAIGAMASLSHTLWQLGEVERARELINVANRRATELGHPASMASPLYHKSLLELLRGDVAAALSAAEALERHCREHDIAHFRILAELNAGWARGRLHDPAGALALRRALTDYAAHGSSLGVAFYQGLLADLEAKTESVDDAVARIEEALVGADQVNYRCHLAFLHRLHGDILLTRDPLNPARAEEAFQTAIAVAKEQGGRSFGLQASLALAKLYQSTGRPIEAHGVLAPALEGFSPTPEMPEIAEAQALLAALAETEEVKVEAAHRQRLTQLRVAYGNVLLQVRGYGAPETTEAFARASESAFGGKDATERLAADYGVWGGSYVRGDLPSMRAHAATFLRDVEARPDSPEASVAHRAAGATCWFAGEYAQARDHLERALALFQPGRDEDLAFRFGWDPGVAAMANLATVSWALGEVDRAVSLNDRMQTRIADLTHVGTLAPGRIHAAMFALMGRDYGRAAQNAVELARLVREHDLPMFRAFAVFLEGLATAASGEIGRGLSDMRRGVELLREQNVLWFDGLLKIVLAGAEAEAGDAASAVASLDVELAMCDRTGYRAFEAELHRVRGEMLLKRDPANPGPAEDALQTAIVVAKHQGTRSFELRAALALAKLWQTTGRPADVRAVLAPTLEGFAPTPEMPEIAEAQALLERLV